MRNRIIGTSDTFIVANRLLPTKGLLMMRTMPWEVACAVDLFTKRSDLYTYIYIYIYHMISSIVRLYIYIYILCNILTTAPVKIDPNRPISGTFHCAMENKNIWKNDPHII